MIVVVLIALGGALGAVARAVVSTQWTAASWPVATMLVNTVASFVAGVVFDAPEVVTVGMLGALSTWSTLALELVELGRSGRVAHAVAAGSVSLVAGIGAAWLGLGLGG